MTTSPIQAAFSALRRQPSLWLAEVAWRWAFGAAALAMLVVSLYTGLDSLPVTRTDRVLLASGSPDLIRGALQHIFRGSTVLVLRAAAVLLPAFVLIWTFAASLGRAAILRALRPDAVGHWRQLLVIHFIRAMSAVAAGIGTIASITVFLRVAVPTSSNSGRPDAAALLFIVLLSAVWTCWGLVNLFLSVAPIYALQSRTIGHALTATLAKFRDRTRQWFQIAATYGLIHFGLLIAFSIIGPMPLAFADAVPRKVTLLALLAITLLYFALADAVALLRLMSFAAIPDRETMAEQEPAAEPILAT